MKLLVTGGAGFVGSHIVDQLLERGDKVVIIDNLVTGKREQVHSNAVFYRIDITDPKLKQIVEQEKPDAIIHQAAQIQVPTSMEDPGYDASSNIIGTINLLEAARHSGVKKIVYASSAAVYGEPQYLPIDENHQTEPLSPYGVSKLTAEYYLKMYSKVYGISYSILRYANVYGIRQDPRGEGGVISILVDKILKNESFTIYGDGEQTRDYIYVSDVAKANIAAVSCPKNGTYNIGTGKRTSLLELIKIFEAVSGEKVSYQLGPERPGDIDHSYFQADKVRSALNWEPKVDLHSGLKATLDYYRKVYS